MPSNPSARCAGFTACLVESARCVNVKTVCCRPRRTQRHRGFANHMPIAAMAGAVRLGCVNPGEGIYSERDSSPVSGVEHRSTCTAPAPNDLGLGKAPAILMSGGDNGV